MHNHRHFLHRDICNKHRAKHLAARPGGTIAFQARCSEPSEVTMQTFVGMILGMLLLVAGVYVYDSMSTSTVAKGQVATANRTIVNWDVAETNWNTLKVRAHDDWIKLSSK
jgi:hypothetical protein